MPQSKLQFLSVKHYIRYSERSVLGPVLFLLYINDMHRSANQMSFVHFADDTTVLSSDINGVHATVNRERVGVDNWLKTNRLSLNVSKTSYMIISNQKNAFDIKIRESILTNVSTVIFLGVALDENLTFNDHVNKVTSKISKSVGVMRRLHCQLPGNVMVKQFCTILWCISIRLIVYWRGEDLDVQMLIECAHRRAYKLLRL